MGKLQPNFSWQKYEGKPEDQKEQFQYQLQQEHIVIANSVNSTIDDISYFSAERATSETWIDGKQIWRKTVAIPTLSANALATVTHGITFTRIIRHEIILVDNGNNWRMLPYVSPNATLPGVVDNTKSAGVDIGATTINIQTGTNWDPNYSGYATLWYLKT